MCLWREVRIRVSQICVVVSCITDVLGPRAPSSRRTFRSSDVPTGECEKEMQCVLFEWGNYDGSAESREVCLLKKCDLIVGHPKPSPKLKFTTEV